MNKNELIAAIVKQCEFRGGCGSTIGGFEHGWTSGEVRGHEVQVSFSSQSRPSIPTLTALPRKKEKKKFRIKKKQKKLKGI